MRAPSALRKQSMLGRRMPETEQVLVIACGRYRARDTHGHSSHHVARQRRAVTPTIRETCP